MWSIPPLGYCVVCFGTNEKERPAVVIHKGSGLCKEHLFKIFEPERKAAKEEAQAEFDALHRRLVHPKRADQCMGCWDLLARNYVTWSEAEEAGHQFPRPPDQVKN